MDDVKKRRIRLLGKITIIVLFVVIVVLLSRVHEPWSDEAQSFLIARDNSLAEIFKTAKYEGTTPTWFIIIKMFISMGGTYETFFLLPLIFTVIGLVIFEFRVKAPWYIKVLLPFTYFILFQYTVVARSYCMVFPAMMWTISVYRERDKKWISYSLALLFLMSICSYTLLIAGGLWLIDVLYVIKRKKIKKREIAVLSMLFFALIGTFIVIYPSSDCIFNPHHPSSIFNVFYQATVGSQKLSMVGSVIITIVFFLVVGVALSKEKDPVRKTIDLIILFMPVLLEHIFLKSEIWHIGIITILIFAAFMMNNMINKNSVIKIMLTTICLVQILWSGASINYDINNNYSGSKDAASFIKQNDFKTIYGLGFDVVALQPYFDHNIYNNQNSEKCFWQFKKNNGYVQDMSLLFDEDAVFVIGEWYLYEYKEIYDALLEKGYIEHVFAGAMPTKNYIGEGKGYYIFTPN